MRLSNPGLMFSINTIGTGVGIGNCEKLPSVKRSILGLH